MRWKNWITLMVALLAIGLVMGACQGDPTTEPGGSAPETTEPAASVAPVEATAASVEIDQEFWFAGFHVDLGAASFDPSSGSVTVEATFENLGSEPAVFEGTSSLAAAGAFYEASATQSLPTVPGLSTGAGQLAFDVDDAFTFEGAVLTVGLAEHQQAVVPFDASTAAVTLEPTSFDLAGDVSSGAIAATLTGAELRADVPAEHGQIEVGYQALTIGFDVTNHGSYAGGFAFSYGGNLALELPDGTTIAADDGPIELLTLGTTLPDQSVRFTIPEPATGQYRFVLIDDTESIKKYIPFEIA